MADAAPSPSIAIAAEPFRGWRVVVAAFTAQLVANASTMAVFGAFVVPLVEDFDTSRAVLSSGYVLGLLLMTAIGPFVGRFVDRGHVRMLMLSGVVIMAASLVLMSWAAALWQVGALYLVATLGFLAATWSILLTDPSYPMLLATGGLFGLGFGAAVPMHGVVAATCFGRAAFGRVMGIGGLVALPIIAGSNPRWGSFSMQRAAIARASAWKSRSCCSLH